MRYFGDDLNSKQLSPDTIENVLTEHSEGIVNYRLTHVYKDSNTTDEISNKTHTMIILEQCSMMSTSR